MNFHNGCRTAVQTASKVANVLELEDITEETRPKGQNGRRRSDVPISRATQIVFLSRTAEANREITADSHGNASIDTVEGDCGKLTRV